MPVSSHCITKKRLILSITVNTSAKMVQFGGKPYPCRIGRMGAISQALGREGDEKTPLGDYALRFGLYRADRLPKPISDLTFRPLREDDGWCDDSDDAAYNRLIRLPYKANHEKLWRGDCAYDIIIVMDHNDSPPEPGLGSAVFLHVAQTDDRQTLGCVALAPEVMVALLRHIKPRMSLSIQS